MKYYIRGQSYIGFSPTPTASFTAQLKYKSKAGTLTSPYDNVELPDNGHFYLLDYMLYKASPKMNRSNGRQYLEMFQANMNKMKVASHKQTTKGESWEIDPFSNV